MEDRRSTSWSDKSMDGGVSPLPGRINSTNFPAKLWHLVNSPAYTAIYWHRQGDVITIDEDLLETQILSPTISHLGKADTFKTSKFTSFIRQLNLYGFRKVQPFIPDSSTGNREGCLYFFNPNFKRNHPELVQRLIRRSVRNKAKIRAGLAVNIRPRSPYQAFVVADDGRDGDVERDVEVCQYCLKPVAPHLADTELQTGPLSPQSYHQESYPVNNLVPEKGPQEVDVDLDRVFQMLIDEMMQSPLNNSPVSVVTPEKPGPVLVPFSADSMLSNNPSGTPSGSSPMESWFQSL